MLTSLDFNLGETANLLRNSVKHFAAKDIAPLAADIDRRNQFPAALWRKLGALGVLGITAPKLISGEHVGALAMSEANSGSDVMSMRLKATKHGDHFILKGTKMWITNGPNACRAYLYAVASEIRRILIGKEIFKESSND